MSHGSNGVDGGHLQAFIERHTVSDFISLMSNSEIWRDINLYPEYQASSFGRIRRKETGRILSPGNVHGYQTVSLCRDGKAKTLRVNIIVAQTFLGDPPFTGAVVAHNDGDRANNRVLNIRWASAVDNQADCVRHNTRVHGSDIHNAKLTEDDIPSIRSRIASGERYPDIATHYGVSVSTISLIKKGKIWKRAIGASWRPSL